MPEVTGTTWTVYDANTLTQAEIYGTVLGDLAEHDPRIVALTADLARSTKIGVFQDRFPERVINVGIAEQNLFGIAAGLARAGMLPFVSTMSAFASMRALEQVRTDICYQNLDVKIIATTVKGKGVDFMENQVQWHYGSMDSDLAAKAKVSIQRLAAEMQHA